MKQAAAISPRLPNNTGMIQIICTNTKYQDQLPITLMLNKTLMTMIEHRVARTDKF